MPAIVVLEPDPAEDASRTLTYPLTLVGEYNENKFKIKNDAGIRCRTIVEIDNCDSFELMAGLGTHELLLAETGDID